MPAARGEGIGLRIPYPRGARGERAEAIVPKYGENLITTTVVTVINALDDARISYQLFANVLN